MKHNSNVLIYIQDKVNRDQLQEIKSFLDQCVGVVKTMVGQSNAKLLVVDYNPREIVSTGIFSALSGRGIKARLVGM